MIITRTIAPARADGHWTLLGPCGEKMLLPHCTGGTARIGLIGTRSTIVKTAKTKAFAAILEDLDMPLILLDLRLGGSGGSGSWGPLEFGTTIPGLIANHRPYSFYHLPLLAPAHALLTRYRKALKIEPSLPGEDIERFAKAIGSGAMGENQIPPHAWKHWQIFRACYHRDLSQNAVLAAAAFVEKACAIDGMCVMLCAEEHYPGFSHATQIEQDEVYCHRYTAATAVAATLSAHSPELTIERHCLRLGKEAEVAKWSGSAFCESAEQRAGADADKPRR